MLNTIDGQSLKQILISAANNLANNEKMVNDLNVFPVPDGDTGTNMSMTILAVKKELEDSDETDCGTVAEIAAHASLRGARGNSGVILSQFLRGFAKGLKNVTQASVADITEAMHVSVEVAYRAVMKPTEGTILTVAREMAEAASAWDPAKEDLCDFLEYVIEKGEISLENTPNLLPQLKQAGVVDSGGMGLLILLKGALAALQGSAVVTEEPQQPEETLQKAVPAEDIRYGYCTEFIIRKAEKKAAWKTLRKRLETIGDSVIVVDDSEIIKVHVHSDNPGIALEEALKLGELLNIKIENMREQNRLLAQKEKEELEKLPVEAYGFIAVAAGDGMTQIFEELGCQQVISGGQTMNPSTEDFLEKLNKLRANTIYVLPNNKNIILAAEQAKELSDKTVVVLPTKTLVQGITAMLAFDPDAEPEENTEAMIEMIGAVKSASVTFAARDSEIDGFKIKKGDIMGLEEGKIKVISPSVSDAVIQLLQGMAEQDGATISLYYGQDVTESDADALLKKAEEMFPACDLNMYNGGQPLYYYYISVE